MTDYNRLIRPLDNQIQFSDEALPKDRHLIWCIVGSRGKGKTTLLLNALNHKQLFKGYFDNVFLVSPTAKNDDKFKPLIKELTQEDKFYNELTEGNIREIMSGLAMFNRDFNRKKNKREPRSLIILDDCIANMPRSTQKSVINELVIQNRHHKVSVWITSQKLTKINPLIRSNVDVISFFKTDNIKELKAFTEEYNVSEEEVEAITETNNDFITVSFCSGKKNIYDKLNLIE